MVAAAVEAENHRELRHEFENLKYNADDPVLAEVMQPELEAITDRTNTIVQIIGEGDTVAARLQITGTHSGNLYGIPATGKNIDIASGAIFKLENEKIVESWFMAEEARLLRQLGVRLPARQDGRINLAPVYDDTRNFQRGASGADGQSRRHAGVSAQEIIVGVQGKGQARGLRFMGDGTTRTHHRQTPIPIWCGAVSITLLNGEPSLAWKVRTAGR